MGVFYQEEPPPQNPSKKCKFLLVSTLKDAFSICRSCGGHISSLQQQQDEDYVPNTTTELEDLDEHEVVVSAIRSRAMEKLKQKVFVITDSFSGELLFSPEKQKDGEVEKDEDFFSVGSCLSCCSSGLSKGGEEFFTVKTNLLSRCSSLSRVEFPSFHRRVSILQELCHCQGWPFGLCRKAVLLPPLPKSPSDSWLWRKGTRSARLP
ncbi:unnamed protein product [Linum tenue]|uniref:Uncharacterized protein n=1 Tax=Linum tenue TaxID=586396 RepID=A0AAV0RIA7_9ROSI|nr:unnamed protein product [Linum tenue]CAI0557408.1 unnamed protein product [Linum tenue]